MISRQEFINNLVNEAMENPERKKQLLNDPKTYIERKLNLTLPADSKVLVHQDTPTVLNIVLPTEKEELSEIELAAVSGAGCYTDRVEGCGYDCPSDRKLKKNIKDL